MSLILLVSILIRIAALVCSVVLWRRVVDWRMGFFTVMLFLMASRQTLTLIKTAESWTVGFVGQKAELPGLVVSVMALLAVLFLERILSDKKRAGIEREKLIGELENRNAELERFNYTVSHDLKTPLVTINGFLALLEKDLEERDAEARTHDIERIREATNQMGELLRHLLELSRLSRAIDATDEVSLHELAAESVALTGGRISKCGVQVTIADDLPIVRCDRVRVLEALQNLLENAIEFMGDQPNPRIEIGVRQENNQVVCFVRDNGCGIDQRYHEKIFGLFERLGTGGRGTGVGLTLTKRIVELHGGRIWVESDGKEMGSTFCFTLAPPVALAAHLVPSAAQPVRSRR